MNGSIITRHYPRTISIPPLESAPVPPELAARLLAAVSQDIERRLLRASGGGDDLYRQL